METKPLVQFEQVTIHQGEMMVLQDVSFSLRQGEFAYLIGKTGSGKSSLLKVMYGALKPFAGEVWVNEFGLHSLRKKQIPALRKSLGIVFQDFQLLPDRTVFDNLSFVLEAIGWKKKVERTERIEEVLDWVDLKTKGFKFPHTLSGGEQQRVAIARALLNRPKLILADEPTGNLDPETARDILRLLHQVAKDGTTVLMATHDYLLIRDFPGRVLQCDEAGLSDHPA
jgi:cell division transport system ATP-binding protein